MQGDQPARSATWPAVFGSLLLIPVAIVLHFYPPVPKFSQAGFLAVTLSLLLAGAVLRARWGTVPRSGFTAALWIGLGSVPPSVFAAWVILDPPLFRDRYARDSFELAAVLIGLVGGICVLVVTPYACTILHDRFVQARRGDAAARRLAIGSVVLAIVFSVLAFQTRSRPERDDYFETYHPVGTVASDGTLAVGSGPVVVQYRRTPRSYGRLVGTDCELRGIEPPITTSNIGRACAPLRMAVDPRGVYGIAQVYDYRWVRAVFFLADGRVVDTLTTRMLRGQLRPPIGWCVGLWGTTAIALVLVVAGTVERMRARRVGGTQGHHDGGGMITVPDVGTLHVDEALGMPFGPVVVAHVSRTEGDGAYRSGGTLAMSGITVGTLEELRNTPQDGVFSLDCAAIAAAWLGLAPMLVAAAYGLLG